MRANDRIDQDEPGRWGYHWSGVGQFTLGKSQDQFSPIPEPDRDDDAYLRHRTAVELRIARSTTPNIIV